jgi:hypothetical protein
MCAKVCEGVHGMPLGSLRQSYLFMDIHSSPAMINLRCCQPKFYAHAMIGPLVLLLGCFNFMRFSRGSVFSINTHRWSLEERRYLFHCWCSRCFTCAEEMGGGGCFTRVRFLSQFTPCSLLTTA